MLLPVLLKLLPNQVAQAPPLHIGNFLDIQKIAYVQRRSLSDLIGEQLEQYRKEHESELKEYMEIKVYKKNGPCNM